MKTHTRVNLRLLVNIKMKNKSNKMFTIRKERKMNEIKKNETILLNKKRDYGFRIRAKSRSAA